MNSLFWMQSLIYSAAVMGGISAALSIIGMFLGRNGTLGQFRDYELTSGYAWLTAGLIAGLL